MNGDVIARGFDWPCMCVHRGVEHETLTSEKGRGDPVVWNKGLCVVAARAGRKTWGGGRARVINTWEV